MADLKAFARNFYDEVFNKGNLAAVDELVADDFVEHEEFPGISPGKAGLKEFVTQTRAAFPDLKFEILGLVADGDEVWAHVMMTGTHQGEFMGAPPTGNRLDVATVDRVVVRDGKVTEHWGVTDTLTMMQQLGMIPEGP